MILTTRRPQTILLVEDDESDVVLTTEAVIESSHDIRIDVVADGEAAIEYLRHLGPGRARPDLILLDLNLPKLSGKEVLERVKGDPDLKRIPVVVLSTSSAPDDITDAYDRGANGYLTKMTEFSTFVSTIGELVEYWLGTNRPSPT